MRVGTYVATLAITLIPGSVVADELYQHGAVAADHPAASAAGVEILQQGGNVVDAAVATSFTLSVVRPASCGIGGGGFMLIWNAGTQQATALDYREVAPSAATQDMFVGPHDGESPSVRGGKAVAVPGTVAGLCYAAMHYGTLPLNQLLAPAIRLAESGVPRDSHDRLILQHVQQTLRSHNDYAERFKPLLSLYLSSQKGQLLPSPQRKILNQIARQGSDAFYRGNVARRLVQTVRENGGLITLDDLADYQPKVRQCVHGQFGGNTIFSMPPPSSGGIALIQTLNTLRQWEQQTGQQLIDIGHNQPDYIHVVAEAMKHAFADRSEFCGDTDFVRVPEERLLSNAYAREIAARIDTERVLDPEAYGRFFSDDDAGTSHLSVIDRHGNAVACTETINLAFGSFVVVPEDGIVLNNEMDDFTAEPGKPNAFGLLQSAANAVAPGKRPLSSMTPTIVVRDGQAILASGGSGGPRIISATLQVVLNSLVFDMAPEQAVKAPRFHHQWFPDVLRLETGFDESVIRRLKERRHKTSSIAAAGVNQTVLRRANGLRAASDPRKQGRAFGY